MNGNGEDIIRMRREERIKNVERASTFGLLSSPLPFSFSICFFRVNAKLIFNNYLQDDCRTVAVKKVYTE